MEKVYVITDYKLEDGAFIDDNVLGVGYSKQDIKNIIGLYFNDGTGVTDKIVLDSLDRIFNKKDWKTGFVCCYRLGDDDYIIKVIPAYYEKTLA